MKGARGLLGIGMVLAVAGCAEPAVPTAPPTQVAAPESGPLPAPSATEDPFADAIHDRALVGLPNDEQHVRDVAADPAAVERGKSAHGFPLTQEELALIEERARNIDEVGEVVRRYAADHQETWAGMFVDTSTGSVIAQFTGNLPAHREALTFLLHPNAKLELRPARWSLADLKALSRSIADDEAWFESVGAELAGAGVAISQNHVEIWIRTNRDDDVVSEIVTHFGGAGRMNIVDLGGVWTGGSGTLIVVARDEAGRPVPNLACSLEADDPDAFRGDPTAFETDESGTCRFRNYPADTMTVTVRGVVGEPRQWSGTTRVAIRPNETVTVDVTVVREP